jgi:urea transport system permease protein
VGAYATFVVQASVRSHAPDLFDHYLLLAIPTAFLSAALVGAVVERTVLRHLYGRPLETLLATWGISLILMQTVRSMFGAQNVAVENPAWMSGGIQVLANLSLPWNRLLIVLFALLVLAGVAWLISQTRLGLFVRGVTQNRAMASCMGVNTARIDTYAFALGSGIAGLAGCALSQIGNVGPDLGQGYIVDAFMVVVLGGVGQLAGTVYAALGLGVLNKWLEGWTGAVLAKIAVLVFIIIFIQKRPQGLFAMKGRSAEA